MNQDCREEKFHVPVILFYDLEEESFELYKTNQDPDGTFNISLCFAKEKLQHPSEARFYNWRDVKMNESVCLNNIAILIRECDNFTKKFLESHQDVEGTVDSSIHSKEHLELVQERKSHGSDVVPRGDQPTVLTKILPRDTPVVFPPVWPRHLLPSQVMRFPYLQPESRFPFEFCPDQENVKLVHKPELKLQPNVKVEKVLTRTPSLPYPMASAKSGQNLTRAMFQFQAPNVHHAPSLVQQPPYSDTQQPTLRGYPSDAPTPQPMMYAHRNMTTQCPLHIKHPFCNKRNCFAVSHAGTPLPIVISPQASHPATFTCAASSMPNHCVSGETPVSHVGTHPHVPPNAPIAMIPTSAAMVPSHYGPQSQRSRVIF